MHKGVSESTLIVSGGQGSGESISEAEAMKKYLVANDIPEDQIIMENQSTSTAENMSYSKSKLEADDGLGGKILLITNDFHMYRALLLAEKNNMIVDGVVCKTPRVVRLNYFVREYYALIKSVVFD